jgi:hypothetical protein
MGLSNAKCAEFAQMGTQLGEGKTGPARATHAKAMTLPEIPYLSQSI